MGRTLQTLIAGQSLAPIHTQPADTLVASPFQATEPEEIAASEPSKPDPCVYSREFKGVKLDPYRICKVYGITDPAIQHAIKKLLRFGRGHEKGVEDDVKEAIQSLQRWQEMQEEDE